MPRNVYFSQGATSEKRLYEDITIEALKIYGHDVYYIPRSIVNVDGIFNEDLLSKFGEAFMIEMYVENIDGFEGEGQLLTKFGVEVRDSMTLILSRRRWEQLTGRFLPKNSLRPTTSRPQEGDLIYFPMVKHLFQITFVEEESPFYQLQNLPTFKLICETFEYNNEVIDTGISEIDQIERDHAQATRLTFAGSTQVGELGNNFNIGEIVHQQHNISSISGDTYTINTFGEVSKVGSGMSYIDVVNVYSEGEGFDISTVEFNAASLMFKTNAFISNKDDTVIRKVISLDSFENLSTNDKLADNVEFESYGNNFIDFTESNPFGEINIST